jgi:hypothetical protein
MFLEIGFFSFFRSTGVWTRQALLPYSLSHSASLFCLLPPWDRSCYLTQANLEFSIFLPPPPKCWDYRFAPPHPQPLITFFPLNSSGYLETTHQSHYNCMSKPILVNESFDLYRCLITVFTGDDLNQFFPPLHTMEYQLSLYTWETLIRVIYDLNLIASQNWLDKPDLIQRTLHRFPLGTIADSISHVPKK